MSFLQHRSELAAKREIKSIIDSYHHYWDLLSELAQNAVDSIKKAESLDSKFKGRIEIKINSNNRSIEFIDNGVGISRDKLAEMLGPGGSDKNGNEVYVGEKGVGLTFCVFSSNEFIITTRVKNQQCIQGKISNANRWVMESDFPMPDLSINEINDNNYKHFTSFCSVLIKYIPSLSKDIFSFSEKMIEYILKTKTAIGCTNIVWDQNYQSKTEITLDYTMTDRAIKKNITGLYPLPHEFLKKNIKYDDLINKFASINSNKDRKKFLTDKVIWNIKEFLWGSRKVRLYGVMFPGHKTFKIMNVDQLELIDSNEYENYPEGAPFSPEIHLAIKGMPTGVALPRPSKGGKTGYYQRCFFLIEYDGLNFDLGRKSIHWTHRDKLQNYIKEMFNQFENYAPYQSEEKPDTGTSIGSETPEERKARIEAKWNEYLNLVDLSTNNIQYKKEPHQQEASVVAIFHELLGAKIIKGYESLVSGYGTRYDLYCTYVKDGVLLKLIVEFKYMLDSVINDLDENSKYFSDMSLIVCWDFTKQKLKDSGLDIEKVDNPPYNGVTHKLSTSNYADSIYIISLKSFIDNL